jgi:hypothetical protein
LVPRNASFHEDQVTRDAWFHGATFTWNAGFDKATFTRDAEFDKARFMRCRGRHDKDLAGATFSVSEPFVGALFGSESANDDADQASGSGPGDGAPDRE